MSTKNKIIYWIATVWLALGMFSTGLAQVLQKKGGSPGGAESMSHLGYPTYLLTLLGIWKLLGVVAILIPRYPLLKEWAYAGFFFAMSGAVYSHLEVGDPWGELFPSVLLIVMIVVSWYLRPAGRKIISFNQQYAA